MARWTLSLVAWIVALGGWSPASAGSERACHYTAAHELADDIERALEACGVGVEDLNKFGELVGDPAWMKVNRFMIISENDAAHMSWLGRFARQLNGQSHIWRSAGVLWIVVPSGLDQDSDAFRQFVIRTADLLSNRWDQGLLFKLTTSMLNPFRRIARAGAAAIAEVTGAKQKAFEKVMGLLKTVADTTLQQLTRISDQLKQVQNGDVRSINWSDALEFSVAGNLVRFKVVIEKSAQRVAETSGGRAVTADQFAKALNEVIVDLKANAAGLYASKPDSGIFTSYLEHSASTSREDNAYINIRPLGIVSVNHRVWVSVGLNQLFPALGPNPSQAAEPSGGATPEGQTQSGRPWVNIELIKILVGDDIRVLVENTDIEGALVDMLAQKLQQQG